MANEKLTIINEIIAFLDSLTQLDFLIDDTKIDSVEIVFDFDKIGFDLFNQSKICLSNITTLYTSGDDDTLKRLRKIMLDKYDTLVNADYEMILYDENDNVIASTNHENIKRFINLKSDTLKSVIEKLDSITDYHFLYNKESDSENEVPNRTSSKVQNEPQVNSKNNNKKETEFEKCLYVMGYHEHEDNNVIDRLIKLEYREMIEEYIVNYAKELRNLLLAKETKDAKRDIIKLYLYDLQRMMYFFRFKEHLFFGNYYEKDDCFFIEEDDVERELKRFEIYIIKCNELYIEIMDEIQRSCIIFDFDFFLICHELDFNLSFCDSSIWAGHQLRKNKGSNIEDNDEFWIDEFTTIDADNNFLHNSYKNDSNTSINNGKNSDIGKKKRNNSAKNKYVSFKLKDYNKCLTGITDMYKKLIDKNYIHNDITLNDFRKIFSNSDITKPIIWTGGISSLYYFISSLHNYNVLEGTEQIKWFITSKIFVDDKNTPFLQVKLRTSKPPADTDSIDRAISYIL